MFTVLLFQSSNTFHLIRIHLTENRLRLLVHRCIQCTIVIRTLDATYTYTSHRAPDWSLDDFDFFRTNENVFAKRLSTIEKEQQERWTGYWPNYYLHRSDNTTDKPNCAVFSKLASLLAMKLSAPLRKTSNKQLVLITTQLKY